MGFGVLGGATIPYHATASNPGKTSAIAGTLGKAGRRAGDATASNLSLPASTSGSDTPRLSNIRSTSPASRPCKAGADPRYGTLVSLTLALSEKSSDVRWDVVPLPCVAEVTLPGFLCRQLYR